MSAKYHSQYHNKPTVMCDFTFSKQFLIQTRILVPKTNQRLKLLWEISIAQLIGGLSVLKENY